MTKNFTIDLDGADFEFITMNRVRLQLFQVYVNHESKRVRFHMEMEEDGNFHIKDKSACPLTFQSLESTMSDAIKSLGEIKTS